MPAVSKKQQRFMGKELAMKREGKKTKTGMSAKQLSDFAGTKTGGLPERKKIGKGHWGAGESKFAGGHCTEVPADQVVNTAHRAKMEKLYEHSGDVAPGETEKTVPTQALA